MLNDDGDDDGDDDDDDDDDVNVFCQVQQPNYIQQLTAFADQR